MNVRPQAETVVQAFNGACRSAWDTFDDFEIDHLCQRQFRTWPIFTATTSPHSHVGVIRGIISAAFAGNKDAVSRRDVYLYSTITCTAPLTITRVTLMKLVRGSHEGWWTRFFVVNLTFVHGIAWVPALFTPRNLNSAFLRMPPKILGCSSGKILRFLWNSVKRSKILPNAHI